MSYLASYLARAQKRSVSEVPDVPHPPSGTSGTDHGRSFSPKTTATESLEVYDVLFDLCVRQVTNNLSVAEFKRRFKLVETAYLEGDRLALRTAIEEANQGRLNYTAKN